MRITTKAGLGAASLAIAAGAITAGTLSGAQAAPGGGSVVDATTSTSAQVAGMTGPGAVTVWERPSRVIIASFGTAACAAAWVVRPSLVGEVATGGVVVGLALAAAGLVHLLVAVRRALAEPGPAA